MGARLKVNGLPLPPLLVSLIEAGRWRHPGDDTLMSAIPFLNDPLDFLQIEAMRRESRPSLAGDPQISALFHVTRGRTSASAVDLPWLDIERAAFVAVNRFPGDDVGIALDYRSSAVNPRVVASEWLPGSAGCIWREVAGTFAEFACRLGLCEPA
ncbi:hypothetical protein AB1L88_25235 [Tautonia sp. JC769]|uniref:hypothetical protein n=1 Tax=Tautonia sp. JC769 TaxID=3232135 RepID=UPI003458C752